DPEEGVRWKAMGFLSRASKGQLESGLRFLEMEEPASPNVPGLRWLLSTQGQDAETIEPELRSSDPRIRKYGAVAVKRRLVSKTDANGGTISFNEDLALMPADSRRLLIVARSSDDPEVARFVGGYTDEQAIRDNPSAPEPYSSVALRHSLDHKPEEAIEAYKQAIERRSQSDTCLYFDYLALAAEYAELNQTTEQIDAIKHAIAFRPRIPNGHHDLGMAYLKLGDK